MNAVYNELIIGKEVDQKYFVSFALEMERWGDRKRWFERGVDAEVRRCGCSAGVGVEVEDGLGRGL